MTFMQPPAAVSRSNATTPVNPNELILAFDPLACPSGDRNFPRLVDVYISSSSSSSPFNVPDITHTQVMTGMQAQVRQYWVDNQPLVRRPF